MRDTESDSRDENAGQEIDITSDDATNSKPRGRDRRMDIGSLFGGYQGPERRSGCDRRTDA